MKIHAGICKANLVIDCVNQHLDGAAWKSKFYDQWIHSKSLIYTGITMSGPQEIGHILGMGRQHALVGRLTLTCLSCINAVP
jgi:hypothetical protein